MNPAWFDQLILEKKKHPGPLPRTTALGLYSIESKDTTYVDCHIMPAYHTRQKSLREFYESIKNDPPIRHSDIEKIICNKFTRIRPDRNSPSPINSDLELVSPLDRSGDTESELTKINVNTNTNLQQKELI